MKKLIGIVFISLMFANIGYAEMTLIEQKFIKGPKTWKDTYGLHISTVCIDGYKFVYMRTGLRSRAQSMVQFYENVDHDGFAGIPAKC